MKKTTIIFIITVLCTGIAWGQIPDKAYEKITEIKATTNTSRIGYYFSNIPSVDSKGNHIIVNYLAAGRKAYFFSGFDFGGYEANHPNLTKINEAQMDAIMNGRGRDWTGEEKISSALTNYSIVGHSQGGLTALGYLSMLREKNPVDPYGFDLLEDIDAVITISGINQGAKVLDNNLNLKGHEKVSILARGFGAWFGFLDVPSFIEMQRSTIAGEIALGFFWAISPKFIQRFYKQIWFNPSLNNMEQVRDMKPGSSYIKKNVVKTVPHLIPVKTGKKILTSEWRYNLTKNKRKIWYLWVGKKDEIVYKTITEAIPQFDPNVPVGFIVGTENRTIRMAEDNGKKVYSNIKNLEISFGVLKGLHIAKCVLLVGLITGSHAYAEAADRARLLCRNIDAELADILGSPQGDGFIPLANQYIPATFTDPDPKINETRTHLNAVLSDPDGKGYIEVKDSHNSIDKNTEAFKEAARMTLEGYKKRRDNGLRYHEDIP